jgi:hypothetical protein
MPQEPLFGLELFLWYCHWRQLSRNAGRCCSSWNQKYPHYNGINLIWHQYGAPPQYACSVRNFLNVNFSEWIGWCQTINWPPCLCDFTPCGFSMWGTAMQDVFSKMLGDSNCLREPTENASENADLNTELHQSICRTPSQHCQLCTEHGRSNLKQVL